MTDDQHGQGTPPGGGRWDPLPQGDYDDGATAFVKLPEGGIDALLAARGDSPLAAPGHGYVPPRIAATREGADPAATGTDAWAAPAGGTEWPHPATGDTAGDDRFRYNPGATGQWAFGDASADASVGGAPAPGHDVTGQWSIPVADGDLPDESGEFTTSALIEQWGGTPPATLPGGASAPWVTTPTPDAPGTPGRPWDQEPDPAAGQPSDGAAPVGAPGPMPPSADTRAYGQAPEHTAPPAPGQSYASPALEPDDAQASQPAPQAGEAPAETPGAQEAVAPAATAQAPAEAAQTPAGPPSAGAGPAAARETSEGTESGAPHDDRGDAPVTEATAASTRGDGAEAEDPAGDAAPFHEEHPLASYVLRVNGSDRPVTDAWIGESLLYVLRERLGLAGAKDGCSQGECGACNVQVDGRLVASCLVPAVTTAGSEIRTVEGLAVDGQPSDVQRALARCGAVQCGFCVPGMAMTVHDLLEGNPAPTELETRQALCGNLCRCSGYRGVLQAVKDVVAEREAYAAADAETDGDEPRIPHQAGPGAGGVHPSAFENPAQPHPHDPAYGQGGHDQAYGQDGGQA